MRYSFQPQTTTVEDGAYGADHNRSLVKSAAVPPSPAPAEQIAPSERDALYRQFTPLVRRLTQRYGLTSELRQELPGEIYCCFCALLESYDPSRGVPLRPYLVRQLNASVYTFARRRWNIERRETKFDEKPAMKEATGDPDPTPIWDARIAQEQVSRALHEAISHLSQRQRQVVIWRYYENRDFAEIAQVLDIQPSTARSTLRAGLNNLRRQIGLDIA